MHLHAKANLAEAAAGDLLIRNIQGGPSIMGYAVQVNDVVAVHAEWNCDQAMGLRVRYEGRTRRIDTLMG